MTVKSNHKNSLDNPARSALHILDTTTGEIHKLDVYMNNFSSEEGIETIHQDRLISLDIAISWSPDGSYIAAGSSEVNQPLAIDVQTGKAIAGEIINLSGDSISSFSIHYAIPELDWQGIFEYKYPDLSGCVEPFRD